MVDRVMCYLSVVSVMHNESQAKMDRFSKSVKEDESPIKSQSQRRKSLHISENGDPWFVEESDESGNKKIVWAQNESKELDFHLVDDFTAADSKVWAKISKEAVDDISTYSMGSAQIKSM